jgi:dephospho-CoA kinase
MEPPVSKIDPPSWIPHRRSSKPVIGLIGGIGSGKSRVAEEMEKHGGYRIAGDQLGHEGLQQPEIRDQVLRHWGREVLSETGEIDRGKLGRIVFENPAELRKLEGLLFPWIRRRLQEEIGKAATNPHVAFVILDAAVLLEAGWDDCCDSIVFVHAPRTERLRRLAQLRGWDEKDVDARERAQMSLGEKENQADFVLDNSGSADQLAHQVKSLLGQWLIPFTCRP